MCFYEGAYDAGRKEDAFSGHTSSRKLSDDSSDVFSDVPFNF